MVLLWVVYLVAMMAAMLAVIMAVYLVATMVDVTGAKSVVQLDKSMGEKMVVDLAHL